MNELPQSNSAKLHQVLLEEAKGDMTRYAAIYKSVYQKTEELKKVHSAQVLSLMRGFHEVIGSTAKTEEGHQAEKERMKIRVEVLDELIASAQIDFERACGEILAAFDAKPISATSDAESVPN